MAKRIRARFGHAAAEIDHPEPKQERLDQRKDQLYGDRNNENWITPLETFTRDDRPPS